MECEVGKQSQAREEAVQKILIDPIKEGIEQAGPACPWQAPAAGQAGSLCPRCGQGVLDYDGMLNLQCPLCKYVEGGCFT
jgi:uncharacterized protein (DUF983 family)